MRAGRTDPLMTTISAKRPLSIAPFLPLPQHGIERLRKLPELNRDEMEEYLREVFPQVFSSADTITIDDVEWGKGQITLVVNDQHLRPGGTVSGPTMMTMVDCCAYICVLSVIGKVALAVTTNLNINFMRKPPLAPLTCVTTPLKVGKSLFVTESKVFATGDPEQKLLAHATTTYSIPPN